jgi:hypothetical protein
MIALSGVQFLPLASRLLRLLLRLRQNPLVVGFLSAISLTPSSVATSKPELALRQRAVVLQILFMASTPKTPLLK